MIWWGRTWILDPISWLQFQLPSASWLMGFYFTLFWFHWDMVRYMIRITILESMSSSCHTQGICSSRYHPADQLRGSTGPAQCPCWSGFGIYLLVLCLGSFCFLFFLFLFPKLTQWFPLLLCCGAMSELTIKSYCTSNKA